MGVSSVTERIGLWLPPLALMVVIYVLSDQPNLNSGLGLIDTIARKLVHAGEYALLCVLWWRALRTGTGERSSLALAFAICVSYAVTDEYHQTFVEGRTGNALDVGIDALGAAAGGWWAQRRLIRARTA